MDLKNNFWKDYPELEKELVQVQQLMKSHVTIKNSDVKSAIFDIFKPLLFKYEILSSF